MNTAARCRARAPRQIWRASVGMVCAVFLLMSAGFGVQGVQAESAAQDVVLTVTGGPDSSGASIAGSYTLADLMAMPKTEFATTTMWTDGVQTFEGVDLRVFLDSLNVTSGRMIATAINDYSIEMPISDVKLGGAMIAYKLNNDVMSVRDKGPLWIVYPYDSAAEYQSEVVFSRSIWQMNRLEIAP